MNSGVIATRYAKGFFEFCHEQRELENVYPFVQLLAKTLSTQVKLREFIADKTITCNEKILLLERVIEKPLPKPLKNFITLIIKKNRAESLLQCLLIFRNHYLNSKNFLDVEFLVAEELSAKALDEIRTRIASKFGFPCEVEVKVKPELIGGYTLIVNGKVFDLSVKGQLNSLKKGLLEKKIDNK